MRKSNKKTRQKSQKDQIPGPDLVRGSQTSRSRDIGFDIYVAATKREQKYVRGNIVNNQKVLHRQPYSIPEIKYTTVSLEKKKKKTSRLKYTHVSVT